LRGIPPAEWKLISKNRISDAGGIWFGGCAVDHLPLEYQFDQITMDAEMQESSGDKKIIVVYYES